MKALWLAILSIYMMVVLTPAQAKEPAPALRREAPISLPLQQHERLPNFSAIVERVAPAVVSIRVTEEEIAGNPLFDIPGLGGFPGGFFSERFYRDFDPYSRPSPRAQGLQQKRRAYAQGSGFIVSPDGYVVTNNHVVQRAQDIVVITKEGTELHAQLVGSDDKTDLALLKVHSRSPLPYVEFDKEEDIKVGDWVLAVGNPFGLGGTVTVGIVSARGRNIGAGPYDDFIQISAAINRGNSGGPTFDLNGHVVGVNTAIISPTGGSVGIGFAIPSSTAYRVVDELKQHGTVRRGWLGVVVQNVSASMAEYMRFPKPQGALITRLDRDGPAAHVGLKPGDVILKLEGRPIERKEDLGRAVANLTPGKYVHVTYWRNYQVRDVKIKVQKLENNQRVGRIRDEGEERAILIRTTPILGLNVAQVQDTLEVFSVHPGSAAEEENVQPGDTLLKVEGEPVRSIEQIRAILAQKSKKKVMLYMARHNTNYFVVLPIE